MGFTKQCEGQAGVDEKQDTTEIKGKVFNTETGVTQNISPNPGQTNPE